MQRRKDLDERNYPTSQFRRIAKKPLRYPVHECLQIDDSIPHHGYRESNSTPYINGHDKDHDDSRHVKPFANSTWSNSYLALTATCHAIPIEPVCYKKD